MFVDNLKSESCTKSSMIHLKYMNIQLCTAHFVVLFLKYNVCLYFFFILVLDIYLDIL